MLRWEYQKRNWFVGALEDREIISLHLDMLRWICLENCKSRCSLDKC